MMVTEGGRRLSTPLLWVMLLLPVLLFYGLVAGFNTGLPTEDDFHGLFEFVMRWNALHDVMHRLLLIVSFQHNEYKMALPYSLLGLELTLTHQISIPLWIWTGNLLVLTMLVPLWLTCAPKAALRERLLLFVPVVWIVMSLGYAETVDFALSGLQVVLVSTLSLATIYLITRQDIRLNYLGCLIALLACLTYANAFMLAPIGIPVLWHRNRKAVFVLWVSAFAVALVAFLYQYKFLPHGRPTLLQVLLFFVDIVGGPFGFHRIYAVALPCGVLMLLLFVYCVRQRVDRLQPFAFWTAVWLLLGFLLTTYGRASLGSLTSFASRYKIYGDLLLAVLYLQVVALWQSGRLPRLRLMERMPLIITAAVLFGLYSDALGLYRLNARRVDVTYGMNQYVETHGVASPMLYPASSPDFSRRLDVENEARQMLSEVIEGGLYHLPARFGQLGSGR